MDTKLAQITTASKVHGSSLTGLSSIPSAAGVIPIANVSTPTNLNITNQVSGDMIYLSGTTWARVPKGTAGQELTMNSGATGPEWADKSIKLIASTSPSGVAVSGDMTIEADRVYLLTWSLDFASNQDVILRFNNDSTGNDYAYATRSLSFANPPVEADQGSDATTAIHLTIGALTSTQTQGWCFINTNDPSDDASVSGQSYGNATGTRDSSIFNGTYFGGAVTSVELESEGGSLFTGEVRLYQLANA